MKLVSKRYYKISFSKQNFPTIDVTEQDLDAILYDNEEDFKNYELEGENEVMIALKDRYGDRLLDLNVGESFHFKPIENDVNSNAIIIRTI